MAIDNFIRRFDFTQDPGGVTPYSAGDKILKTTLTALTSNKSLEAGTSLKMRVTVAFSVPGALTLVETTSDGDTDTLFNQAASSPNLKANGEYSFPFDVVAGDKYDFKYSGAAGNLLKIKVTEIIAE